MKKYMSLAVLSITALQLPHVNAKVKENILVEEKQQEATLKEKMKELEKSLKLSKTQRIALSFFKKAFTKVLRALKSEKGKEITAYVLNKLAVEAEGYIILPEQKDIDAIKQTLKSIKEKAQEKGIVEKGEKALIDLVDMIIEQQEGATEG